ncbi:MAG: formylmethanofuran dehydrogenase subunit C [Solirubrobacteraceae bacterium]
MTLTLTLREAPAAPLRAEALCPDRLAGLSRAEIERLELWHGNRRATLGELFAVSGAGAEDVRVVGDLGRVAGLGAGMTGGRLTLEGSAGPHVGAGMGDGELIVEGDVGDWAGAEMRGGRLIVRGSAGRRLGGAYAGARAGMHGGEVLVHGDAGEEAGAGLRRGLIAVAGRVGAAAGLSALAGTIVAFGTIGAHPGAGMRRASIVAMTTTTLLPSYSPACTYRPPFLRLCLRRLRALGLPVTDEQIEGRYTRWSGDSVELTRGEILILEPPR